MFKLTVHDCVRARLSTLFLLVERKGKLRVSILVFDLSLVEAESVRVDRKLYNLLVFRSVTNLES